jgi:hypothetical protein
MATLFTTTQTNANFPGKEVQENNNNIVVSNTNAAQSLAVVRGIIQITVNGTPSITNVTYVSGEGFSISFGSNFITITFSTAFNDVPAVNCTYSGVGSDPANPVVYTTSLSASSFSLVTNGISSLTIDLCFTAVGERV